jgi:hypothetical protein
MWSNWLLANECDTSLTRNNFLHHAAQVFICLARLIAVSTSFACKYPFP